MLHSEGAPSRARARRPPSRFEPQEEGLDNYDDGDERRIGGLVIGTKRKREAPLDPRMFERPIGAPMSADDMAPDSDDAASALGTDQDDDCSDAEDASETTTPQKRAAKKKKDFAAARKKREREERRKAMQTSRKQRETLRRVSNLQNNPRRDLIQLVPCRARVRAPSDAGDPARRAERAMRWEITTQDGRTKTLPGVTTVLSRVMYSTPEECKYNTVPPDVVGFDAPTQGPGYASRGLGSVHDADARDDVCGYDAEAQQQARRGQYRCVGRGIEHGRRVHEQLGRLVQRWIVDGAQFPSTYATDEMTAGRLDPCVAKIVTLLLEMDWTPIWSEYQIYDETLGFATAVDLVCTTHGVQRLAFLEIKTSTRRNALELFMRGDAIGSMQFMRGPLQNQLLDTGLNRAAMQLMATEAIMQTSYLDCRPHTYQVLFVSSDADKATLLALPVWCWDGAGGQLGLNRRIIRNMLSQYAKHSRMEAAVRDRVSAMERDVDEELQRNLDSLSPRRPQSPPREGDEPPIRLAPRTHAPPLPVRN
jgi:hypothetical protein